MMWKTLAGSALAFSHALALVAQEAPSFSGVNEASYQHNRFAVKQGQHPFNTPEAERIDKPNQYQEQLSLMINWGALSGSLSVRHTNYYKAEPYQTLDKADTSLYRINLKYVKHGFSVQAGDFNATLGKGLVLSVIQNDAVMDDRILRGGDFQYSGAWFDIRALAGRVTNHLNKLDTPESPEINLFKEHDVLGGEARLKLVQNNWLGVHASRIDRVFSQDPNMTPTFNPRDRRETLSASMGGNNLFDLIDYHVEMGRMTHWDRKTDYGPNDTIPKYAPNEGKATYATLSVRPGSFMLMAEHRYYINFEHELVNPPLADWDKEKLYKTNTRGTRLLAQYVFPNGFTLFASHGKYEEGDLFGKKYEGTNTYGGIKFEELFEKLNGSITYGSRDVHSIGNYVEKKLFTDLSYEFMPLWSLGVKFNVKEKLANELFPYSKEWDTTTQLSFAPWGVLYWTHQYASFASTDDHIDPLNPFKENHLNSGGIRIQLSKKGRFSGSYLEVSGGRIRGGEGCGGGVCRTMPSFDGWRVATSLRF